MLVPIKRKPEPGYSAMLVMELFAAKPGMLSLFQVAALNFHSSAPVDTLLVPICRVLLNIAMLIMAKLYAEKPGMLSLVHVVPSNFQSSRF